MALVKCKECKREVSSTAKTCPNCGAKVPKRVGILGWIFVLVVVLPIAYSIGSKPDKTPAPAAQIPTAPSTPQAPATAPATETTAAAEWTRSEHKDAMTDETFVIYSLRSNNSTAFEFPYTQKGGSYLTINVRHKGGKIDAYMDVDKGQMLCSSRDCSFSLRIGEAKTQEWTGSESSTNISTLMFVRDAAAFERIIKSAAPLRIGIKFFQSGTRVFEFTTTGYPAP